MAAAQHMPGPDFPALEAQKAMNPTTVLGVGFRVSLKP